MGPIDKLTEYFMHFPGIGPRQAKRFVYHLLTRDKESLIDMANLIRDVKSSVKICENCFRFFVIKNSNGNVCNICISERNHELLMVVPRDNDLEQIEKTKAFNGYYFVLGGTLPILDKNPESRIRIRNLKKRIEKDKNVLKEIILATNLNPEGEHTMDYIEEELKPIIGNLPIKISHLGRGMSTGNEIEYSDPETLKYALKNRF